MKIGIATFNNAMSYGAMIQAFALKTVLFKMGHKAEVIPYLCPGNVSGSLNDQLSAILNIKENLLKHMIRIVSFKLFQRKKIEKKFSAFHRFRTQRLYSSDQEETEYPNLSSYDMLICGSDQIWNPNITDGYRDLYFGISGLDLPAISYAASAGDIKIIEQNDVSVFLSKVKNLRSISCREKQLNQFLQKYQLESNVVLDPTLLLCAEDYRKLETIENVPLSKYVLVFKLGKSPTLGKIAARISKERNVRCLTLVGSGIPYIPQKNVCGDLSPEDFISLIHHAEYVVTDSFHGLALSLVFHKNFSVVLPKMRSERLKNLLESVGMMSRIVDESSGQVDFSDINYAQVENYLSPLQEQSIDYLRKNLGMES